MLLRDFDLPSIITIHSKAYYYSILNLRINIPDIVFFISNWRGAWLWLVEHKLPWLFLGQRWKFKHVFQESAALVGRNLPSLSTFPAITSDPSELLSFFLLLAVNRIGHVLPKLIYLNPEFEIIVPTERKF